MWPDWAIYWTLGNFLKPLTTINLSKSTTFFGIFCKGVKIFNFFSKIILGNFFRHLATFCWSRCSLSKWKPFHPILLRDRRAVDVVVCLATFLSSVGTNFSSGLMWRPNIWESDILPDNIWLYIHPPAVEIIGTPTYLWSNEIHFCKWFGEARLVDEPRQLESYACPKAKLHSAKSNVVLMWLINLQFV